MASTTITLPTTGDVVEFMFKALREEQGFCGLFKALREEQGFCGLFKAFKAKYPALEALNILWETVVELRGIGDLLGLHEGTYYQDIKDWEKEEAKKVTIKQVTDEDINILVNGMRHLAIHNFDVPTPAIERLGANKGVHRLSNEHPEGSKAHRRASERVKAKDAIKRRNKKEKMRKLGGGGRQ